MSAREGKVGQYHQPSAYEKLKTKTEQAPFVPLGIAGMVGAVVYGAYSFKNKGKMSTSVFLMHLRVRAQSMVVGAIALGVGYSLLKDYVFHKKDTHSTTGNTGS